MAFLRIEGLDDLQRRLKATDVQMGAALEKGLLAGAVIVEREAKDKVPVDTKKLKDSIRLGTVTGFGKEKEITVGTVAGWGRARRRRDGGMNIADPQDYAESVEYGSRPHVIRPKTAKALAWPLGGGKTAFAMSVNHPGTSARPFLIPALKNNQARILRAIQERIEQLLRRGT